MMFYEPPFVSAFALDVGPVNGVCTMHSGVSIKGERSCMAQFVVQRTFCPLEVSLLPTFRSSKRRLGEDGDEKLGTYGGTTGKDPI